MNGEVIQECGFGSQLDAATAVAEVTGVNTKELHGSTRKPAVSVTIQLLKVLFRIYSVGGRSWKRPGVEFKHVANVHLPSQCGLAYFALICPAVCVVGVLLQVYDYPPQFPSVSPNQTWLHEYVTSGVGWGGVGGLTRLIQKSPTRCSELIVLCNRFPQTVQVSSSLGFPGGVGGYTHKFAN